MKKITFQTLFLFSTFLFLSCSQPLEEDFHENAKIHENHNNKSTSSGSNDDLFVIEEYRKILFE